MPVTNYYTVDGEIIGEKTTGGSRIDYLTDALGSVTATMNQSAQVVNTYRYKPYGALLAKTGVGTDPSFQWVGSRGYKQTGKKFSDFYVRARHNDSISGRWTSMDPIRTLNRFIYVSQNPVRYSDKSGMQLVAPPEEIFEPPPAQRLPVSGPISRPGGTSTPYYPGEPQFDLPAQQSAFPWPLYCPTLNAYHRQDCRAWHNLCDWAHDQHLMGPQSNNRTRYGTVICCYGRIPQVCLWKDASSIIGNYPPPKSIPINMLSLMWTACLAVHENYHIQLQFPCGPFDVGPARGNTRERECAALEQQMRCLLPNLERACHGLTEKETKACKRAVYEMMRRMCENIHASCDKGFYLNWCKYSLPNLNPDRPKSK